MDDSQLESLIEDLTVEVATKEKDSLWNHYLPQHLKLHLAKQILNYTVPRLNRLVPDRKPELPVTKIVDRVFRAFEKMVENQQGIGVSADKNFLRLVRTVRRTLTFIAEEDCYYERWLHILFLVLHLEVKHALPQLAVTQKVTKPKRSEKHVS